MNTNSGGLARQTSPGLTLAITALRGGDIEAVAQWMKVALGETRRSVGTLSMIADEVRREVDRLYPSANAVRANPEHAHGGRPQSIECDA